LSTPSTPAQRLLTPRAIYTLWNCHHFNLIPKWDLWADTPKTDSQTASFTRATCSCVKFYQGKKEIPEAEYRRLHNIERGIGDENGILPPL
jgi:hypothetical protein